MKISQIKQWQDKCYHYSNIVDSYAQRCAEEIQKYCDFEIKFAENDPSDGLVICYDNEDYNDVHTSVDTIIEIYQRNKRKITLNDLNGEY